MDHRYFDGFHSLLKIQTMGKEHNLLEGNESDMSNSIETTITIAFFGTIAIGIAIAKAIFQLLLLLLVLLRQSQNYCS